MDFSDFDMNKVNDILSTLSQDDVENLSKIASDMFSSGAFQGESSKKDEKNERAENKNSSFPFSDMQLDPESMAKIFSLMNKLKNQPEDQRIKLLYALRPMLTEKRRRRVDQAVQMMRIMAILPLLRE